MLNGLDLFSGIGGLSLALEPWVVPIAYCENDRHAQAVLLQRMWSCDLHVAPIWDDVRTLQAAHLIGVHEQAKVDIIYGGFPCQDISVAGAGAGLDGSRSGLFYEIARLTSELRPRFVFLENVPAITLRGLDRVLMAFTEMGYDTRWTVVSAAEMGAPHRRERWFLLAHSTGERLRNAEQQQRRHSENVSTSDGEKGNVAYSDSNVDRSEISRGFRGSDEVQRVHRQTDSPPGESSGAGSCERRDPMHRHEAAHTNGTDVEGQRKKSIRDKSEQRIACDARWWESEPDVGRVADGVSLRVERLRGLGNAVVPYQAREAFIRLMGLESLDKVHGRSSSDSTHPDGIQGSIFKLHGCT